MKVFAKSMKVVNGAAERGFKLKVKNRTITAENANPMCRLIARSTIASSLQTTFYLKIVKKFKGGLLKLS